MKTSIKFTSLQHAVFTHTGGQNKFITYKKNPKAKPDANVKGEMGSVATLTTFSPLFKHGKFFFTCESPTDFRSRTYIE